MIISLFRLRLEFYVPVNRGCDGGKGVVIFVFYDVVGNGGNAIFVEYSLSSQFGLYLVVIEMEEFGYQFQWTH